MAESRKTTKLRMEVDGSTKGQETSVTTSAGVATDQGKANGELTPAKTRGVAKPAGSTGKGQQRPRSPGRASPACSKRLPAETKSGAHSPKLGGSPARVASAIQGSASPKRRGSLVGQGVPQKRGDSPRPGGSPARGGSLIREGPPAHGESSPRAGGAPSPTPQPGAEKSRWGFDHVLDALGVLQGNEELPRSRGTSPVSSAQASLEDVGPPKRRQPEATRKTTGKQSPPSSPRSTSPRFASKGGGPNKSATDRPPLPADRDAAPSFIEHVSSRSKSSPPPKPTGGINLRMAVFLCCVAVLLVVIVAVIVWQLVVIAEVRMHSVMLAYKKANSTGKQARLCTGGSCASNDTRL